MKKNKVALLVVARLIINTACTENPQPQEQPLKQERKAYLDKHYKKLPQSVLDGIPYPATKEQAKKAGFKNCDALENKQFKCTLNRTIKFEEHEFDSAYIVLNTDDNLIDYPKSSELGWEVSDMGRFQADLERASLSPSDEYSYRTIHLITKNKDEQSCSKRNAQLLKKKYAAFERPPLEDCSNDAEFIAKLEKNGWKKICYEAANGTCTYNSKNAHFRIVHSSPLNFEVEPLSPSHYGAEYNRVVELQQLTNETRTKEQDFIKSMND